MATADIPDEKVADIPLAKAKHYLQAALDHLTDPTSLDQFEAAESELDAARAAIREGIDLLR